MRWNSDTLMSEMYLAILQIYYYIITVTRNPDCHAFLPNINAATEFPLALKQLEWSTSARYCVDNVFISLILLYILKQQSGSYLFIFAILLINEKTLGAFQLKISSFYSDFEFYPPKHLGSVFMSIQFCGM